MEIKRIFNGRSVEKIHEFSRNIDDNAKKIHEFSRQHQRL
jgi:hypothetical protein